MSEHKFNPMLRKKTLFLTKKSARKNLKNKKTFLIQKTFFLNLLFFILNKENEKLKT